MINKEREINMNKKVGLLLGTVTAALVLAAVSTPSNPTKDFLVGLKAFDTTRWSHYAAVNPGIGTKGIKEYWVSCGEGHEHTFTKPNVDNSLIDEKGAPSQTFIDSLEANDNRLLEALYTLYDFEDEVIPQAFE